jgi:hypothetical protein
MLKVHCHDINLSNLGTDGFRCFAFYLSKSFKVASSNEPASSFFRKGKLIVVL